jgi:two-component system OmpR family response regulator
MSENKISQAWNPSHRILVVDNEPLIREISTEVLIHSGYLADAAEDSAAAWQALNNDYYDLLVTDHNMPKVSGVGLLKKLHAARMSLPVILMTGAPPTEELKRQPWLQIDAVLLKPFTVEELLITVKKVLRPPVGTCERIKPPANLQSRTSAMAWC